MDGERPGGERRYRTTRRGLLALAGASVAAGCSAIDGLAGDERTISAYDLPDVDGDSIPDPVVAPSVPVDVAPGYFADSRDRVTALLDDLPMPLGPDAIPNGHVRQRLVDAAEDATAGLDGARGARTGLAALRSLREARESARYAATGWAFADRGLSASSLREERRETVSEASSAQADHEYVGADPVRAALVHARIERFLERATDEAPVRAGDDGELLTVAEWGEAAESARVALEDARHLESQFAASLPSDAGTVEGTLRSAAETLLADVRSRRSDLPPEPTAEDWSVAERVVSEVLREADYGADSVEDTIGPASAVVDATERLAWFRALDSVRERVDAGEISRPESAGAVRTARNTADGAVEAALAESPAPELARAVAGRVSWRLTNADRQLDRFRRDVRPARLDSVVEDYAVVTAVARATPAACQQAADALGST